MKLRIEFGKPDGTGMVAGRQTRIFDAETGEDLSRHVRRAVVVAEVDSFLSADLSVFPSFVEVAQAKLESVTVVHEYVKALDLVEAAEVLGVTTQHAATILRALEGRGVVLGRITSAEAKHR